VTPGFDQAPSPTNGTVGGVYYDYVLDNGNYWMPSLVFGWTNTLRVTGNAILCVAGDLSIHQRAFIEVSSGASLKLYVGGSASLSTSGVLNRSGNPLAFQLYGMSGNENIRISSTDGYDFTGTIYAPNALLFIHTILNPLQLNGACFAKWITIAGPCHIHYDENLRRNGPQR